MGARPREPGMVGQRILLTPGELSPPTQPAPRIVDMRHKGYLILITVSCSLYHYK